MHAFSGCINTPLMKGTSSHTEHPFHVRHSKTTVQRDKPLCLLSEDYQVTVSTCAFAGGTYKSVFIVAYLLQRLDGFLWNANAPRLEVMKLRDFFPLYGRLFSGSSIVYHAL